MSELTASLNLLTETLEKKAALFSALRLIEAHTDGVESSLNGDLVDIIKKVNQIAQEATAQEGL